MSTTAALPGNRARAQAFWAEPFNQHDLRRIGDFIAPGFVNSGRCPMTRHGNNTNI
jgi:hypothetical protein